VAWPDRPEASSTLAAVTVEGSVHGRLLTIEGPEGAGKTTQAEWLRRAAQAAGIPVVVTREPGGTPLGEQVRALLLAADAGHDPRADALLFNAARAQLVGDVIRPALARGEVVVCTRFADSTLAYQGYGAGVPIEELRALADVATGGLVPDLTVLLDVPTDVGLARKSDEQTRFETDFPTDFHRRVRDGFLALAAAEPERFAVIDAARPADAVAADVLAAASRLPGLEALAGADPTTRSGGGEPERIAVRIPR
jgi:dTMP kinase